MPPLGDAALPALAIDVDAALDRRVHLHGRWLAARTVYLDNRQMDAKPGFYVVTPLLLGRGDRDAVLVERGWVPRNFADRTALPRIDTAEGEVDVEGRIAATPSRMFELGPSASGPIRQNLDPVAFARETTLALRPVTVVQTDSHGPPDGLSRRWPEPAVDVQKHYGYAVQWFAIAALIAALYVWHRTLRLRQRRH